MPDLDLARRHIGIYAYRVAELTRFVSWAVAPIERSESLEQLRFIWNSVGIHIADAIEPVPGGIDTEQDLESAIKIIKSL
jgi:3-deoxy-manno-octulosonate cytidylyltransferase (CMP-KDO synthetase)